MPAGIGGKGVTHLKAGDRAAYATSVPGSYSEARVLHATHVCKLPDAIGAAFARVHRVLLLRAPSGVGFDIALGGLPFEESAVARATPFEFPPHVTLRTCSAEDLIVLKAFADRPKDWVDVDGVLLRQQGRLEWPYIRNQLAPLVELKEAPQILEQLERRLVASEA